MGKKGKNTEELIRRTSSLQLPIMDLAFMRVSEEDIEILTAISLSALQILLLSQNRLGCPSITTLPQAYWPILKQLNLGSNKIGNKGVKYVVMTKLPQLEKLILDENIIDDAGMKMLMKGKWDKLQSFYLSDNNINGAVQYVVKGHWKELEVLHVNHLILNVDIWPLFDLNYIMLAENQQLQNFAFDTLQHSAERIEQQLLQKFKMLSLQLPL